MPHLWAVGAVVVIALTQSWAPTIAWVARGRRVGGVGARGRRGSVRELARGRAARSPLPLLGALVVVAVLMPPSRSPRRTPTDGDRPSRDRAPARVGHGRRDSASALALAYVGPDAGRRRGRRPVLGVARGRWGCSLRPGLVRDLRPAFARTRARVADGETAAGHERRRPVGRPDLRRRAGPRARGGPRRGRRGRARPARRRPPRRGAAVAPPGARRGRGGRHGGAARRGPPGRAVDEVEGLLVSRRSIVLEELGLLAGVEWLAERVEDRSDVRVEIEVGGETAGDGRRRRAPAPRGGAGGVPGRAARARQRDPACAGLDGAGRRGVVRDARSGCGSRTTATGRRSTRRRRLRAGRRGIADMRAEARACGASLDVGRGAVRARDGGRAAWPA